MGIEGEGGEMCDSSYSSDIAMSKYLCCHFKNVGKKIT
jgi:hypothetical protein